MRHGQSARKLLIAGVSVLAFTAIAVPHFGDSPVFSSSAYAQGTDGHGGGEGKGAGGSGGGHDGGSGSEGGKGAGKGGAGSGKGQGGPSADSEGKGPKAGEAGSNKGGKPAWAQEGIPEVELGRLNVARSPDKVLARSLAEVISNFDPATMASLYEMTATEFAAAVLANWDTISIIDSPLENLALLDQLWSTGTTGLPTVDPASVNDLAGILIGVASDKNVAVTDDTVEALATIFGVSLSDSTISTVADKAEDVREAISAAHG
ncbi:hypothetical protein [Hoeflea sp.]|uniref:hypothetical protein n=1 Tax=Hoeflea sp. TaxID=1940281 RepID=UPI0019904862|nr:hypothetical protein [Hoeflea sp.]MBC7283649.1 hypothetical protein [Hoeflea sp.]